MKEWQAFRIDYRWEPVVTHDGEIFTYPGCLTADFRSRFSKPAVYRWLFKRADGCPSAAYIGEAENLAQRIQGYHWPGQSQQTNLRMKADFQEHIESGGTVELQVLVFEPFAINNVNVHNESQLGDAYIRKMMENFLLADHDSVACELRNAKSNSIERRLRKSAKAATAGGMS